MKLTITKISFGLALLVWGGGSASAQDMQRAYDAYNSGDYTTALSVWTAIAESGSGVAQNNLGVMYEQGLGVAQDYREAVKWYRLSAEQGFAAAQYNLGLMYDRGQGVTQDYREAVKWYRLSAEQGNANAQANLGAMYGLGEGVIQDHAYAHMWSNIAAANGHEKAKANRDLAAKKMTTTQIARAQELARQCVARNYKGC